jgi:hypothetical protein
MILHMTQITALVLAAAAVTLIILMTRLAARRLVRLFQLLHRIGDPLMPELRARPIAAVRYEIDSKNRDMNAYRQRLRRGDSGPPGSGRHVQIRNGMPDVKPYVYRGTGHDILTCPGPDRCRCNG